MTKQNGFLPSQADPGLAWHAGLLVGHPSIDEEHETFVRLIAALKRAPDDNLGGALDTLAAHAQQPGLERIRRRAHTPESSSSR